MNNDEISLSPNELAFIALTNEYCQVLEQAAAERNQHELTELMLKLLPRIYISANDLIREDVLTDAFIEPRLDETLYDQVRDTIAQVMADEDVYLEVFLDDMRYSDTPIATTISENLADLYQEFYNFVNAVQDAPSFLQAEMLMACANNFKQYWGQTLCNVLRALHCARHNNQDY